jgi:hypothetical protein
LHDLGHHLRDGLTLVLPSSEQESLNVEECLFRMLEDKPVSCMVLAVAEHGQEPFRAMLVALVFRVVEDVGGSDRVEQVLDGLGRARRSG